MLIDSQLTSIYSSIPSVPSSDETKAFAQDHPYVLLFGTCAVLGTMGAIISTLLGSKPRHLLAGEVSSEVPPVAFVATADTPLYAAEHVGGKSHNVLKLIRTSSPVPKSLIISTQECRRVFNLVEEQTGRTIQDWLSGKTKTSTALAAAIAASELSSEVRSVIGSFVEKGKSYAVRSSGTVEDGADSAFAGQFDTFLHVDGDVAHVETAVLGCYASLLKQHLLGALQKATEGAEDVPYMSVVVMEQVDSRRAGVCFQANPITKSTSTWMVNSTYGQGEGVVGGMIEVDTFYLNPESGSVKGKNLTKKTEQFVLCKTSQGIVKSAVPEADQEKASLTNSELKALFNECVVIRKAYNSAQDIEFAFDENDKLYVLQARPITTLSEATEFVAPDVGLWKLNGHLATPPSLLYADMWKHGMSTGSMRSSEICGIGFAAVETAIIGGFAYFCFRQPGPKAPPAALPPPFVLRMIMRLTARKAISQATDFWVNKRYLEFAKEWDAKIKPDLVEAHLEMQTKDLKAMNDEELAKHVETAYEYGKLAYFNHARYSMYTLAPSGWFVIQCTKWTGCDVADAYGCMEGFSPISSGVFGEFPELVADLASDSAAVNALKGSGSASSKLAKLTSPKQKRLLACLEYRLADGYDVADATFREVPEVLVGALNQAVSDCNKAKNAKPKKMASEILSDSLRERVPEEHRAEFDDILSDARACWKLRDERALYTDLWANGIVRHVYLEAGARIKAKHASEFTGDISLVLEASQSEVLDLLKGSQRDAGKLLGETLSARKASRMDANFNDAPAVIGGVDLKPGREHFPNEYLARSALTVILSIDQIFETQDFEAGDKFESDPSVIRGVAASKGVIKGTVALMKNAQDAAAVKPGQIVVTKYPSSAINLILPVAGAIVTDLGGALCHAAICAREASMPCVVGAGSATARLKSGDVVEVNGDTGRVTILSSAVVAQ